MKLTFFSAFFLSTASSSSLFVESQRVGNANAVVIEDTCFGEIITTEETTKLDLYNAEVTENTLHEPNGQLRYSGIGIVRDRKVDLVVTATDSSYSDIADVWEDRGKVPDEQNGKNGKFGRINLQTVKEKPLSGRGNFKFCFHDTETDELTAVDTFRVSVFDFDERSDDVKDEGIGLKEKMLMDVTQSVGYQLYPNEKESEIKLSCEDGTAVPCAKGIRTVFHSSTFGTGADNPHDPNRMTEQQKKRSVTFTFKDTDCWTFSYDHYCPVEQDHDEIFPLGYDPANNVYTGKNAEEKMKFCRGSYNGGNFLFSGDADEIISEGECITPPPTDAPSSVPSSTPTASPTYAPTTSPSLSPSESTPSPTKSPTAEPTESCECAVGDEHAGSFKCGNDVYICPGIEGICGSQKSEKSTYWFLNEEECERMKQIEIGDEDNKCIALPEQGLTEPKALSNRVCYNGDYDKYGYKIDGDGCEPCKDEFFPPTKSPTASPTIRSTPSPTMSPTAEPTNEPTSSPSSSPSKATLSPTMSPTIEPTNEPTSSPSSSPSKATLSPTMNPTKEPTNEPTSSPSAVPTASLMPTGCTEPATPKVIESICMTTDGQPKELIPMPANAVAVSGSDGGDNLAITVTQSWSNSKDAGMAIRGNMDHCVVNGNMTWGSTEELEEECVDGIVEMTVVVYLDEDFDPDECKACNADDLAELGGNYEFCAYVIEVPCKEVPVECAAPTIEPSSSPSKATLSPTMSPTMEPTNEPTSSPSAVPTISLMPTGCTEPAAPKVIESICMTTDGQPKELIPMPANAVAVSGSDGGDNLAITVTQSWSNSKDAGMAIRGNMDHCIVNGNMTWGSTEELEEQCVDGIVEMTVVVYLDDDFDPDECDACNVGDLAELGGNYEFCAYLIEVPCEEVPVECAAPTIEPSSSPTGSPTTEPSSSPTETPTAEPSASRSESPTSSPTNAQTNAPTEILEAACPEDLELVAQNGSKDIDLSSVVRIVSQDTSTVKVSLRQGWDNVSTIDHVFYSFKPDNFDEKCYEETSVEAGAEIADTIEIQCNVMRPYALLEICVADDLKKDFLSLEDDANVPKCCHPSFPPETPTVCYKIKIQCVTECVEEEEDGVDARRGLRGSYF